MFRKSDLTAKHCLMFSAPDDLYEREAQVQPDDQGVQHFSMKRVRLSSRSKECLDPRLITLKSLIEANQLIPPARVAGLLNLTDPAELDGLRQRLGENVYKYLLENKDAIIEYNKSLTTK